MDKLTNDSYNQMYIYHQLTIHNSHDSEDEFCSGCQTSVNVNNNRSFENYTNPEITLDKLMILLGLNHLYSDPE